MKNADQIFDWFRANVPEAKSELDFDSPFRLLVAVILSAQCTDKRVNKVTPELFERFPGPEELSMASFEELYPLIRSVSYPNSKTRHLIDMARLLCENFGGEVPDDIDALMTLPGVGRKTANVVASIVYNKPVIAVDTHVGRISRRLGLSSAPTPEGVERDLEALIPLEDRAKAHHWLLLHGRYVCTSRKPHCSECGLASLCPSSEI